jgi:arylsulfatase A-like enzyme
VRRAALRYTRRPLAAPRSHPALVGALLLGLLSSASGCGVLETGPRRIVFIVVDTLRSDRLSVYGSELHTPNVAALAARGQVFSRVRASFHQTSMSMSAMMTGRTPSIESGDPRAPLHWNSSTWCGLARFSEGARDTCIPRSVTTLAERLRDAGWWTIGVVSNQFLYEPSGFGRGFEDWVEVDARLPVVGQRSRQRVGDPKHSRDWRVVNRSAFEAVERAPGRRSFLYVHYIDVHDYRASDLSYGEAVERMDVALGDLLAGLEQRGFLEDAVVIFTSDHGERLGEDHSFPGELPNNFGHYGNPSFEEMLRIPLIVAPPVAGDPSRLLRTQDFFDLVLQIAGLEARPAADLDPDELFVGELYFRTYRKGRWKSSVRREDGKAFLYDLETDPHEQRDLSGERRLLVLSHRQRLNALSESLAAERAPVEELSESDRERLRALGYLDD